MQSLVKLGVLLYKVKISMRHSQNINLNLFALCRSVVDSMESYTKNLLSFV
ncbi:Hypothetical protein BN2458_PEG0396 [Helicobacter typhlonius]|uniref:Uncharacterized protein n=1 Tax=Helicobacter typhlonius TaxID=76936 RepID=A0A0S4PVM8_9HELI|nr:Hypothetical protein BN2458_PEG0396 [Helicobacter typhlonius]